MVVYAWTPVLGVGGRRIGSSKPALATVLVRVPIVVIKHHDRKQRGEVGKKPGGGTGEEAIESTAHGIASQGLLSLMSYRIQDHSSGLALPTVSWTFPH